MHAYGHLHAFTKTNGTYLFSCIYITNLCNYIHVCYDDFVTARHCLQFCIKEKVIFLQEVFPPPPPPELIFKLITVLDWEKNQILDGP